MADPLYELLVPYFGSSPPSPFDPVTAGYLTRLTTLPIAALSSSEPSSLSQSAQSALRSLQALAKRSYKPIISSADHLAHLHEALPAIGRYAGTVESELPQLETAAERFAQKYSKSTENAILDRRRKAMLLARNIDRISDVLDLPTLLSSAVSSSTAPSQPGTTATSSGSANYTSALDLYAHIKRLSTLYPQSLLISSVAVQAEEEMKIMTTNLIHSLQSSGIKLAGGMRAIGWLRRVAPELEETWVSKTSGVVGEEGSLGALFLVCRLACLESMLAALDPLKELADQEADPISKIAGSSGWGQQTERYLKRYIEIFREQSFAIISMYRSIFPSALPVSAAKDVPAPAVQPVSQTSSESLNGLPSALATFSLYLVDMLFDTLRTYLPSIQDRSSRESLLTQVLYCAGSLGRLGADFSMMIALLEEDLCAETENENQAQGQDIDEEWIEVIKKHRVQSSRLELLASGVGTGRKTTSAERTTNPS